MNEPLTFLGNGSCFNVSIGNTSAFFRPNGKTLVLIDCGENIFERIMKHSLLSGIENIVVFITHLHSDHVGSLPTLLFGANLTDSIKTTSVVCENTDDLKTLLKICGGPKAEIFTAKEFSGKFGVKCTALPAVHGVMLASSFIFETPNHKFFFSGDTSKVNPILPSLLSENKLDYIYHDTSVIGHGMHTMLTELEKAFAPNLRSKVFCTHVASKSDMTAITKSGFNLPKIIN